MHRLQDLLRHLRSGLGYREAARLLKMSPNTERVYRHAFMRAGLLPGDPDALPSLESLKALLAEHEPTKARPQQQSSAEPYRQQIQTMFERGAGPKAIYDALRLEETGGPSCSLYAVQRLCRTLKRGTFDASKVAIRVETLAGEVAQVDFGSLGKLYDPSQGRMRQAYVFVMVLGFSRQMFCTIVFDQKVSTWVDLHRQAFEYFGGVPRVIVPDNLKSAVLRAAFNSSQAIELNRSYAECARHYGFLIDPAPAYQPQKKGKVERAIRYIRSSFVKPRKLTDAAVANRELRAWLETIANRRVHATTGRIPQELFEEEEKAALGALPNHPYDIIEWKEATVHPDAHIHFDRRFYSVPYRLIGSSVWVKATTHGLKIYHRDDCVAHHQRQGRTKFETQDEHLPKERSEMRHRSRDYWEKKAAHKGPDVLAYIKAVFDSDDALYRLRDVQNIMSFLKPYPPERANAACRRALYYQNTQSFAVKDILRKGLDAKPLPQNPMQTPPQQEHKYNRNIRELIQQPIH